MVAIVLVLMWKRFDGVPMSVLVIYPFALSALLGAPRLLYRAWKDYQALQSDSSARRVLILGAGQPLRPWSVTCAVQAISSRSACWTMRRTCAVPSCRACRSSAPWTMRRPWSVTRPSCW